MPSSVLARRQFLKLILLTGLASGCTPSLQPSAQTPTDSVGGETPLPPATRLPLDIRFVLENEAVSYAPHPKGCDQTTIEGVLIKLDQADFVGITIQISGEAVDTPLLLGVDEVGRFSVDVASGLSEASFTLEVIDSLNGQPLSEPIIVQSLPSCEHNLIQMDLVATKD